jgi:uncharacterized protein DUF6980
MMYCCEMLAEQVNRRCKDHDVFNCPDNVIVTTKTDTGYGLPIRDGGSSFIEIKFCPFCGDKL